jgi:hypothetical protein
LVVASFLPMKKKQKKTLVVTVPHVFNMPLSWAKSINIQAIV